MRHAWTCLPALLLAACAGASEGPEGADGADGTDGSDGTAEAGVTWHQDIAPIVVENCAACHTAGGLAPFELDQYATASSLAGAIGAAVAEGTMPPFGAHDTDECQPTRPWKGDMRLSDDEKALIAEWVDAGAPEGDAATAAEIPTPPSLEIESPDWQADLPSAWTVDGVEDQFICFVLDPDIDETRWITDIQFLPGNEKIDHHALVYHDIDGISEDWKGEDGTYDCFGDVGDTSAVLLATWTPGAAPMRAPEGAGFPLWADSRIVVQMHYHPTGDGPEVDLSALQLKWIDEEPAWEAAQALLGNNGRQYSDGTGLQPGPNDSGDEAEFVIPAGVSDHVETLLYEQEIDIDFPVYSVGTHMHYVGTDMKIDLVHNGDDASEPESECLLQTPKWDFNWQRVYDYDVSIDELPVISKGEQLVMRCTYDNTMDNPYVRQALAEQGLDEPQDVYLGDETLDEMCLGLFGIVAPVGLMEAIY